MKSKNFDLQERIDKMNQYSLVAYLKLLGYTPTRISKKFTTFSICGDTTETTLVVNNKTNRVRLSMTIDDGTLIDLVSCLFHAKPDEILTDIVPYRLDQLMSAEAGKNAVHS
jgi:hypothetical protein